MARSNRAIVSDSDDDEFPDLLEVLGRGVRLSSRASGKHHGDSGISSSEEGATKRTSSRNISSSPPKSITKASYSEKQIRKQRPLSPLKPTRINSVLLPISIGLLNGLKVPNDGPATLQNRAPLRLSPQRVAKAPIRYNDFVVALTDVGASTSEEDDTYTDLSGFVVYDSASEEEEPPRSRHRIQSQLLPHKCRREDYSHTKEVRKDPKTGQQEIVTIDLTSPKKDYLTLECAETPPSKNKPSKTQEKGFALSDLDEPFATLRLLGNSCKLREPY